MFDINLKDIIKIIVLASIELGMMFLMLNSTSIMTMIIWGVGMVAFAVAEAYKYVIIRNKNDF